MHAHRHVEVMGGVGELCRGGRFFFELGWLKHDLHDDFDDLRGLSKVK